MTETGVYVEYRPNKCGSRFQTSTKLELLESVEEHLRTVCYSLTKPSEPLFE